VLLKSYISKWSKLSIPACNKTSILTWGLVAFSWVYRRNEILIVVVRSFVNRYPGLLRLHRYCLYESQAKPNACFRVLVWVIREVEWAPTLKLSQKIFSPNYYTYFQKTQLLYVSELLVKSLLRVKASVWVKVWDSKMLVTLH
jgi:hypothetical protein